MGRMLRRDRKVGPLMRLVEDVQAVVTTGDWPARLADALGLDPSVGAVHHTVELGRPLGASDRLRVAFAADWHAGPTTSDRTLEQAVTRIVEAEPDAVLLGGDFVSLRARHGRRLIPFLRRLEARHGVFAVLGNHDHYSGAGVIAEQLEEAGVTVLRNRSVALPAPHQHVSIVGLDDHGAGDPDAELAFEGVRDVRILVMHQPSGLLDLNGDRIDLALAGHTHGGQIVLPGLPPLYLPHGRLSRRYPAGRFETERGPLLVSRGVGCTLLPVRWNAAADVLIVDLLASGSPVAAATRAAARSGDTASAPSTRLGT